METTANTVRTFTYRAQTVNDRPVAGTIDAADYDAAHRLLEAMHLRVLEVAVVQAPPPARAPRGQDFQAFNQQLAYLTQAGLPVEAGLRLIAREIRGRRMAKAIEEIATAAEAGRPLGEAFDAQRQAFPPLYGRLIDAGVRSGNLPGVLFNLGRHLEMVQRIQAVLWQNLAYPVVILIVMLLIMLGMGSFILPKFQPLFADFNTTLPGLTIAVMSFAQWLPWLLGVAVAALIVLPLLWTSLKPLQPVIVDALLLRLPFLGAVLRAGRNARWCDALSLGIEAGLDLPQAMELATDVIGSPEVNRDAQRLLQVLKSGGRLGEVEGLSVLNGAVGATLEMASEGFAGPSGGSGGASGGATGGTSGTFGGAFGGASGGLPGAAAIWRQRLRPSGHDESAAGRNTPAHARRGAHAAHHGFPGHNRRTGHRGAIAAVGEAHSNPDLMRDPWPIKSPIHRDPLTAF